MAKIKLYRHPSKGSICLQLSNGDGDSARYVLPVKVTDKQWNGSEVVGHPRRVELNVYLSGVLTRAQVLLLHIQESEPTRNAKASDLLGRITAELFHKGETQASASGFYDAFEAFTATHANKRTREIYQITGERVREFWPGPLAFEDVTVKWIDAFDRHLSKTSPSKNARAIHLRNIRACFNWAIDQELTDLYPFRRYTIKREETDHRDLTSEEVRRLFAYQPPTVRPNKHHSKPLDYAVKYVDLARLMFYLIGINVVDFWHLRPEDMHGGRIHYRRAKTGAIYDVKVEPEALAIIEKYRGTEKLLAPCEGQANYKDFAKKLNDALKRCAVSVGLPPVTTYWLRHSWATIAYAEAGIPIDTISDGLGHKNAKTVTLGYVDKLKALHLKDEANRAVIDLIEKSNEQQ